MARALITHTHTHSHSNIDSLARVRATCTAYIHTCMHSLAEPAAAVVRGRGIVRERGGERENENERLSLASASKRLACATQAACGIGTGARRRVTMMTRTTAALFLSHPLSFFFLTLSLPVSSPPPIPSFLCSCYSCTRSHMCACATCHTHTCTLFAVTPCLLFSRCALHSLSVHLTGDRQCLRARLSLYCFALKVYVCLQECACDLPIQRFERQGGEVKSGKQDVK